MRRIFATVLAAAAALLTACGETENSVGEESSRGAVSAYSSSSASESAPPPEISADREDYDMDIEVTANGQAFSAVLYDNETANALKERLPLTIDMSELNGNEKYFYLPEALPTSEIKPSEIHTGDIMLYHNNCLVIFYKDLKTSYSYTPIGKINDPKGLAKALGDGGVSVKFEA